MTPADIFTYKLSNKSFRMDYKSEKNMHLENFPEIKPVHTETKLVDHI